MIQQHLPSDGYMPDKHENEWNPSGTMKLSVNKQRDRDNKAVADALARVTSTEGTLPRTLGAPTPPYSKAHLDGKQ